MRGARAWACGLLATLALGPTARAEDAQTPCLPEELRMRVKFAEPQSLAAALVEIEAAKRRADKREIVASRFREAGCERVEEQGGAGIAVPNLVCRIPGKNGRTIAIGSSPLFDGWASAALLPELARAVASSPREHGYAIALLERAIPETPAGARVFADALAADGPVFFLHLGQLGAAKPLIGPESDDRQACGLKSLASALGTSIDSLQAWNQVSVPCPGTRLLGLSQRPLANCESVSFVRFLDVDPFLRADVPVLGVYAYAKRDESNFSMSKAARLDAATYVISYRLLAAYAVVLDQLLAPPTAPTPAPAAD